MVLPGDSNKTDGYLKQNPLRPPVLRPAGAWPQAKCLGALRTAARATERERVLRRYPSVLLRQSLVKPQKPFIFGTFAD